MLDHMADLIAEVPTIVAGDFNFSAQPVIVDIRAR
jgi:endonuclease/exonuclease/phosphatase family metal-dependent hydrolase